MLRVKIGRIAQSEAIFQYYPQPQLLDLFVPGLWSCLSTLNVKESDSRECSRLWGFPAAAQTSAGDEGGMIQKKGCDWGAFPWFKENIREANLWVFDKCEWLDQRPENPGSKAHADICVSFQTHTKYFSVIDFKKTQSNTTTHFHLNC